MEAECDHVLILTFIKFVLLRQIINKRHIYNQLRNIKTTINYLNIRRSFRREYCHLMVMTNYNRTKNKRYGHILAAIKEKSKRSNLKNAADITPYKYVVTLKFLFPVKRKLKRKKSASG